jgi:hypothetical protein
MGKKKQPRQKEHEGTENRGTHIKKRKKKRKPENKNIHTEKKRNKYIFYVKIERRKSTNSLKYI